ncbi:MAG: hypothetical protein J3K34DRAFT_435763 [Monoraphidium minutum]|nr:MAG: hypothetical protein J3K34DRAFT_435763 [Monoraphidium minutum]
MHARAATILHGRPIRLPLQPLFWPAKDGESGRRAHVRVGWRPERPPASVVTAARRSPCPSSPGLCSALPVCIAHMGACRFTRAWQTHMTRTQHLATSGSCQAPQLAPCGFASLFSCQTQKFWQPTPSSHPASFQPRIPSPIEHATPGCPAPVTSHSPTGQRAPPRPHQPTHKH